ncbi:NAD(P)H-binding protein [Streptomyces sp. NPDC003691]
MPTPLHAVLGTGGIGTAVVHELARRGHRVRAVSRRPSSALPPGVTTLAADLSTAGGARAACAGADVVYHCVQPPYHRWPQEFPRLTEAIADAAAAAGAKLVLADNLYAYEPTDGPLSERTPGARPAGRAPYARTWRTGSSKPTGPAA